jgi:protein TonB
VAPEPAPAPKTIPDSAVQYLEKPDPVYPAASRRRGETGRVLVRVQIGADGRVHDVRVARSSGHARLDESALSAVRAARFKPHIENGAAVTVWSIVPIDFLLEN